MKTVKRKDIHLTYQELLDIVRHYYKDKFQNFDDLTLYLAVNEYGFSCNIELDLDVTTDEKENITV